MSPFTDPNSSPTTKAAVHGAVFALVALCCGYNLVAYRARGERHSAVQALVYGGLLIWELVQIRHHAHGVEATGEKR